MALPEWIQFAGTLVTGFLSGTVVPGLFERSKTKLTGAQTAERQAVDLIHQGERQELDLAGQDARQNKEHDHQRAMLTQAAHFEVRREMAELAADVLNWLSLEMLNQHGDEADMFPANTPGRPYEQAGDAIGDLRKIYVMHPTKAVRELAARLSDDIGRIYNSVADDHSGMEEPDLDRMLVWTGQLNELIELINEPPARRVNSLRQI